MILESKIDPMSENTIIEIAELQKLYDRIAELEAIIERAIEKYGDQWGNL